MSFILVKTLFKMNQAFEQIDTSKQVSFTVISTRQSGCNYHYIYVPRHKVPKFVRAKLKVQDFQYIGFMYKLLMLNDACQIVEASVTFFTDVESIKTRMSVNLTQNMDDDCSDTLLWEYDTCEINISPDVWFDYCVRLAQKDYDDGLRDLLDKFDAAYSSENE